MTLIEALVLGIVQGASEFLPISSTAHLRIVPALLGWEDPGAAFTAVTQWGTLIAVVLYFRSDLVRLTRGFFEGVRTKQPLSHPDSRLAWMIGVGTIPIVIAGLLLKDLIEGELRSLYVISGALIGLALVLIRAEKMVRRGDHAKTLGEVTWRDAILIGVAQAFALIPGTSRSGVTIAAGLFLGLSRPTAAHFSFLLSLPSIFAAGLYELYAERATLLASGRAVVSLVVASVVAGIVGYASIAFLLRYLRRHSTYLFIVYRILLGVLLLALLAVGALRP